MIYDLRTKNEAKIVFFILVSLFINLKSLLLNPGTAFAQEVALSISPPITELTIQPGKSYSQTFSVTNDGVPVVIIPKIFPFVPFDAQGHAELIEDPNSINAFSNWFSFDPSPVSLTTTASHSFIVKISPPANISERDYYFTFIAEVQNDNNLGITSSQAQTRIGANLLLTISKDGNPQKKASIIEFSALKLIDSFSGLTYKILIGNSGFSFFKPVGKITADQIFGATTVLNLAPLNILVGGTRDISCIQEQDLVPCNLPGKFLIGVYRSNLSFTVDGSGENIEKQIYTIAFPFSITLGLITIFITYRIIRKLTH
jgi:hypothetical protein